MQVEIISTVKTERLGNRLWVLLDDYQFYVDDMLHVVPKGFVYDGNSTPRAMWSICSPVGGAYGEAGIVHDWFYSLDSPGGTSRKWTDELHMEFGKIRGASWVRRKTVYRSLRMFGAGSYRKKESLFKLDHEAYDWGFSMDRVEELKGDGGYYGL